MPHDALATIYKGGSSIRYNYVSCRNEDAIKGQVIWPELHNFYLSHFVLIHGGIEVFGGPEWDVDRDG